MINKFKKFNESLEHSNNTVGITGSMWNNIPVDDYMEYHRQLLGLYLDKLPEDSLYREYFKEDGHIVMQDFINSNIKDEFQWLTGIGIMESVDNLIEESISNGNIK